MSISKKKIRYCKDAIKASIGLGCILAFTVPFVVTTPTIAPQTQTTAATRDSSCSSTPIPDDYKGTYIDVAALHTQMSSLINQNNYVFNVKEEDLRSVVFRFVKNVDVNFSKSHIIFNTFNPETDGYIHTQVTLNHFKDAEGNVVTSGFTPVCIDFGPFQPAHGVTQLTADSIALPLNPGDLY